MRPEADAHRLARRAWLCRWIGHRSRYESGGPWGMFAYSTPCEWCGKREVKNGWLTGPPKWVYQWLSSWAWQIKCAWRRWRTRNEPPPF